MMNRRSCCTVTFTEVDLNGRRRTLRVLPMAIYAILLCLVPFAVSQELNAANGQVGDLTSHSPRGHIEPFSDVEIQDFFHHRKHNHAVNRIENEDDPNAIKEWTPPGHRKKHRNASKSMRQQHISTSNDYDEKHISASSSSSSPSTQSLSTKDVNSANNNLKYLESDKKYFDYFPIEDVELNYDPKEDDIRVVLLSSDSDEEKDVKKKKSKKFGDNTQTKKLHSHHHRMKRDTTFAKYNGNNSGGGTIRTSEGAISKRNVFGHPRTFVDDFLDSQRGNNILQGGYDYSRPAHNLQHGTASYPGQVNPNDPWNNRFSRPLGPYYLPVPRPIYNPTFITFAGFPINCQPLNPSQGYIPPQGYLPPRPTNKPYRPGVNQTGSNPQLGNRFGENDDDRIIWDIEPSNGRDQIFGGPPRPTFTVTTARPTTISTRKPPPPLIHRPNPPATTARPTTARQNLNQNRRPTQQASSNNRRGGGGGVSRNQFQSSNRGTGRIIGNFAPPATNDIGGSFDGSFSVDVPRQTPSPPTRLPPAPSVGRPTQGPDLVSRCIWGILTCCQRNNLAVRYNCFEQLGCHGAFWDLNPCTNVIQDAALDETSRFFDN